MLALKLALTNLKEPDMPVGKTHRFLILDEDKDVIGGTDDEELVARIEDSSQDSGHIVIDTSFLRTTLTKNDFEFEEEEEEDEDD